MHYCHIADNPKIDCLFKSQNFLTCALKSQFNKAKCLNLPFSRFSPFACPATSRGSLPSVGTPAAVSPPW